MGALFRWPAIWEDRGFVPNRPSYVSFEASLFITENKVWWGVWNSGKFRFKKDCSILALGGYLCPRGSSVSPWNTTVRTPPWLLRVSCGAQRSNCLWSPGVRVDNTCSSRNNSFSHALPTRLINYYLKLKYSNSRVPHHSPLVVLNYLVSIRSVSYGSTHFAVEHAT